MAKKNRYAKCYTLFKQLASNKLKDYEDKESLKLMLLVIKNQMKRKFKIKSLRDLDNKRLKEFEKFLYEKYTKYLLVDPDYEEKN